MISETAPMAARCALCCYGAIMAEPEKIPLKCVCVHPDAHECSNSRSSRVSFFDGFDDEPDEELPCECGCHYADEDGMDDWDRAMGRTWEDVHENEPSP